MQNYLGVKRVEAEPCEKDGKDGYRIIYPDGYKSWSPKKTFEAAYFPIAQEDRLTKEDIDNFLSKSEVSSYQGDPKTTVVRVLGPTGFVDWDTASCVNPENYNEDIGREIALGHITDRLWMMLGFVLQWGIYGLCDLKNNKEER